MFSNLSLLKVERIPEVYLQHIIKSHIFFPIQDPRTTYIFVMAKCQWERG